MSEPQRIGDTSRFKFHKNELNIRQKIYQKYNDTCQKLAQQNLLDMDHTRRHIDDSWRREKLLNIIEKQYYSGIKRAEEIRDRELRKNGLN